MTTRTFYALQTENRPEFFCISLSVFQLDASIQRAFVFWRGTQAKGARLTMADYLKGKERVKVVISPAGVHTE